MKFAAGILLCLMGVVGQAQGAAIQYTINFTTLMGTGPTSGSFKYDATITNVGGSPFSDFFVVWQGINFDFTHVANTQEDNSLCPTPSGTSVGNFNFSVLFALEASPCGGSLLWTNSSDGSGYRFFFTDDNTFDQWSRSIYSTIVIPDTPPLYAAGSYTVSPLSTNPVPEPITSIMTMAGVALLLMTRSKQRG